MPILRLEQMRMSHQKAEYRKGITEGRPYWATLSVIDRIGHESIIEAVTRFRKGDYGDMPVHHQQYYHRQRQEGKLNCAYGTYYGNGKTFWVHLCEEKGQTLVMLPEEG